MKIQLDTTAKTIKVEGSVNLEELFEALKKLLPQGEWKQFTLEANTSITWVNPITIPVYPTYPYNPYPWWGSPIITYTTSGEESMLSMSSYALNEGVYNIEV